MKKRLLAELIGTMVLVFMGCRAAVLNGKALAQLRVFIAAPFAGAILAAGGWGCLADRK